MFINVVPQMPLMYILSSRFERCMLCYCLHYCYSRSPCLRSRGCPWYGFPLALAWSTPLLWTPAPCFESICETENNHIRMESITFVATQKLVEHWQSQRVRRCVFGFDELAVALLLMRYRSCPCLGPSSGGAAIVNNMKIITKQ